MNEQNAREQQAMRLLMRAAERLGQSEVARQIGCSRTTVNQICHGKYKGSPANILEKVIEAYGAETVVCPVLGEIPLSRCSAEKQKPFGASSPQRVRLARACPSCTARRGL